MRSTQFRCRSWIRKSNAAAIETRLEFHPQVASDISTIMRYYEVVSETQLADDFYAELRGCFLKAAEQKNRISFARRNQVSLGQVLLGLILPHRFREGDIA